MPYKLGDMLEDLDIPKSLGFLAGQSQNTTEDEDPYALPKDGSMDWKSLPNGTAQDSSGFDERKPVLFSDENRYEVAPSEGGLWNSLKSGFDAVSGFIKDNKELSQMIGDGIAGAYKDQNAKEMAGMQIQYLKDKQDALNKSVTSYGKTYKKA